MMNSSSLTTFGRKSRKLVKTEHFVKVLVGQDASLPGDEQVCLYPFPLHLCLYPLACAYACTPPPSTWSGSSPCPSRSTPPSLAPSSCWAPSTPGCGRFLVRTQGSVLDLRLSTSRRGTKIQQGWLIPFQQNIYFCICKVGASC